MILRARHLLAGALACAVCLSTLGAAAASPAQRNRRRPSRAARAKAAPPARARASDRALTPRVRAALDAISADSLRGHLSFIASDALEGRRTPSRGLDLAAEYLAAQFRRAGLEPVGDEGGYFQTATWAAVAATSRRAPTPAAEEGAMKVRNVAGVLRGSDPALRDTYVIVSAHYDHVGTGGRMGCQPTADDSICNGANDDGSGTVALVEIASALSRLTPRPRRSVLFIAFFGEEWGLLGSRWYGRHPLVPLEKTVAQVNMEQVGRTDDSEGPQLGAAAVTGFDYSDVGATLEAAGAALGVKVYKHPTKSDAYFSRSDNQALADLGIPAHTLGVAFEFPDYHSVGDHWDKIDYANMERIVRAVALGALMLANEARDPRWNEANPRAAPYAEAWRKLHGQ